jgi:hypothetical protein
VTAGEEGVSIVCELGYRENGPVYLENSPIDDPDLRTIGPAAHGRVFGYAATHLDLALAIQVDATFENTPGPVYLGQCDWVERWLCANRVESHDNVMTARLCIDTYVSQYLVRQKKETKIFTPCKPRYTSGNCILPY